MEEVRLKKETYDKMMDIKNERDIQFDELEIEVDRLKGLLNEFRDSKGIIVEANHGVFGEHNKFKIIQKGTTKEIKEIVELFNDAIKTEQVKFEQRTQIRRFKKSIWFKIYSFFNKS